MILFVFLPLPAMAQDGCAGQVARTVSVEGVVEIQRAGDTTWIPAVLNDPLCPGDRIRVMADSRAALAMSNESVLRLDQNTSVTVVAPEKPKKLLLRLISGAVHFFSHLPRSLSVETPFVNGVVEGTEFFVKLETDRTHWTVFRGRVATTSEHGDLLLSDGKSAVFRSGEAPELVTLVRPRDAVQWALHYPALLRIDPSDLQTPLTIAQRLMSVGRVDEAKKQLDTVPDSGIRGSDAHALRSIIAVVQNQKEQALLEAHKAVEAAPDNAAAHLALSFALQADFNIEDALEAAKKAAALDGENGLVRARLAELYMAVGDIDRALIHAKSGAALSPDVSRSYTVLGFAYLAQIRLDQSEQAFAKAIRLDSSEPIPRLGRGLVKIRRGDLDLGREDLEIAVSLDPNNSLIRSYLGKAFFEEKRDDPAGRQFEVAKTLDPNDPTPWLYDAVRKQTENRPVEALQDLQRSIELNDNRAVYRSKLLLDDDLAMRSAGLGRIYNDLGFGQLALAEGWKSLAADPTNHSAHRFLADTYASLPGHQTARVSELLQSQLLQPANLTPIQPQLAVADQRIVSGGGPSDPSFNEFNPYFVRDRVALQISGAYGTQDTRGDDVVVSGLYRNFSFSLGQYHSETEGYRDNNEQKHDIYNAFLQYQFNSKASLMAEIRFKDDEFEDLPQRFDKDNFLETEDHNEELTTTRIGGRYAFTPQSMLIGALTYQSADFDTEVLPVVDIDHSQSGYIGEVQHLFQYGNLKVVTGGGHLTQEVERTTTLSFVIPPGIPITDVTEEDIDSTHTNLYIYPSISLFDQLVLTAGVSAEWFDVDVVDDDQVNPKLGAVWTPLAGTMLRAAYFRTVGRTFIGDQTLEPTNIAGFNQFYTDFEATDAYRYGLGLDQKLLTTLFTGAEFAQSDLEVPFTNLNTLTVENADWKETIGRGYLYWIPMNWMSLRGEYIYEYLNRGPSPMFGNEQVDNVTTHRVPLEIGFYCPYGITLKFKTTYVEQEGDFVNMETSAIEPGDDAFWVADASISYRLPRRFGLITLSAINLFDEDIHYQDTDPENPTIAPEQTILLRATFVF